ncbi:pyridoxal phosphate-dependent aminotransferase [Chloroflexus sp.]|uniref:pyridoxal phosphate-dependent aminotransferase n=1 Tax=Chloroflexus sp. TaxID=1904827 RepID=UPI0026326B95|nr:histidinol-phosphate transaminase [uncultured Chloroflexus sp.]
MESGGTVVHGALDEAELAALGVSVESLIDFSSNINPFGPPAAVLNALQNLNPAPYPDRSCLRLRRQLAARHQCHIDSVLVGNGANELIHLTARALGEAGAIALIVTPVYGEYAHACRLVAMPVVEVQSAAHEQFQLDLNALLATIAQVRPRLVWLCSPNNPVGTSLAIGSIIALAHACADINGWLVLDRAYFGLGRDDTGHDPLDQETPARLIRIYSLTKSYAVAGLRIGYLIADPAIVAAIARYQPAWSVSSAAQTAALAMLADTTFLPTTLSQWWAVSDDLMRGLRQLGLTVWRAHLPFMLAQCANGALTRRRLLARGCVVRDCTSFGLPEWVRVAPRRPAENARLLAAWQELLELEQ